MKKIKLCNVFFPLWLIILMPPITLLTLPINFIIDSLVLLLSLKIVKDDTILHSYKNTILKVWIFGFIADLIGTIILFIPLFANNNSFIDNNLVTPLMTNPFSTSNSFFYTLIAVLVSASFIYFFNVKYSLKNIKNKAIISFLLALITAPYFFFFPSELLYKTSYTDPYSDLTHYRNTYVGDNSKVGSIVNYLANNKYETTLELKTDQRPYTIIINCSDFISDIYKYDFNLEAAIIFNLVTNADEIIYKYDDKEYLYTFDKVNQLYDNKLRELSIVQIRDKGIDNENNR